MKLWCRQLGLIPVLGFIRLNHLPNCTATGSFCCEIFSAYGNIAILMFNSGNAMWTLNQYLTNLLYAVDIEFSITAFGTNVVGEVYYLKCSVIRSRLGEDISYTSHGRIQWTIQLTTGLCGLYLVEQPHSGWQYVHYCDAGNYTCRVAVGSAVNTATEEVIVQSKTQCEIVALLYIKHAEKRCTS